MNGAASIELIASNIAIWADIFGIVKFFPKVIQAYSWP